MRATSRCAFCMAAVLAFAAVVQAASVDNPRYQGWAKFKKGSNSTYSSTISMNGMQIEVQSTSTLEDFTDDQVTVEVKVTVNIMGQPHTSARTTTIPAKVSSDDLKETGEEDVKAMDRTFKCKVYDTVHQGSGTNAARKIWVSAEVPGGMVKFAGSSPTGAGAPPSSGGSQGAEADFILTAFEVK
jgi:hypothetical protein